MCLQPDRQRRLGRNFCRDSHYPGKHFLLAGKDAIDQTCTEGLIRGHASAGIGQFADQTLWHLLNQSWESAHVRSHTDVDFEDRKESVLGAVAHIAGRHHIQSTADTAALNGGQNG